MERSEEVLRTDVLVTIKESSRAELKKTFLERTQRRFGKFLFCSRNKSCFISIRYPKTSQTQDVKSESTKRSLRKLAQPKRYSASEQKTRTFHVERSQQVLKTNFVVTTKKKNQSRAQKDVFGTYSTSFWKVGVFLSVKSPIISRTVCTKINKTIACNTKRWKLRIQINEKLFL